MMWIITHKTITKGKLFMCSEGVGRLRFIRDAVLEMEMFGDSIIPDKEYITGGVYNVFRNSTNHG